LRNEKGAGRKRLPPAEKIARGTYQPCEDDGVVELGHVVLTGPNDLPQRPDFLTAEGEEVWMDNVARVVSNGLIGERDSELFATYCNLQGKCRLAWQIGEIPPPAETRLVIKLSEYFGIAGAKSRTVKLAQGGEQKRVFSNYR
jgi:hypothetical protein